MKTERFKSQVKKVLAFEEGYIPSNIYPPCYPGGETNFGISKRAYPHLDIKNLTEEQATEIYFKDYYQKVQADILPGKPLSFQVFDMAVNAGPSRAIKILQSLVYTKEDGILGPITLNKVSRHDPETLAYRYMLARIAYYVSLNNPAFLKGWITRVLKSKMFSYET